MFLAFYSCDYSNLIFLLISWIFLQKVRFPLVEAPVSWSLVVRARGARLLWNLIIVALILDWINKMRPSEARNLIRSLTTTFAPFQYSSKISPSRFYQSEAPIVDFYHKTRFTQVRRCYSCVTRRPHWHRSSATYS